jgi:TonB-linked SusC/RagA family outer membrane protein
MIKRLLLCGFFFLLGASVAYGQTDVMIEGTVTDATTDEVLVGVNVVIPGTTTGTVTNAEGQYSLEVPSARDSLSFSFVGYETRTVSIGGRSTINIGLQPATLEGEEVVVVGYGQQEQESVSSAVSSVDSETINEVNPANAAEALQGALPGAAVMDRGGAPGAQTILWQIRGNTTIGGTEPLVLINGIEGSLSDVNPNNISSVSVLKDASATAIYGSRAANGVVLIETKEAQAGQWNVEYDSYVGVDEVSEQPELLGTMETLEIINQAYRNNGSSPRFSEEDIQAYREGPDTPEERYENPPLFPFFDALFSRGTVHNHNLSASGGTERLSARINFHYQNQEGIIPNFNEEVKGLSMRSNFEVSDRITLNGRVRLRRSTRQEPQNAGGIYWDMWHGGIGAVPQYPDGTYGLTSNGVNPLMAAQESGTYEVTTNKFGLNLSGDAQLLDDLTYTMEFGGHADLIAQDEFTRSFDVHDWQTGNVVQSNGPNGLWERRDTDQTWTWRNLLEYDTSFGVNDIEVLGGFEQTWSTLNWVDAYRQEFYNNQLRVLDSGSQNNLDNSGTQQETRLRSGFARLRYVYDSRYIAEVNGRVDGSSLFTGADNQYGFFPSFSLAWRLDQESFWEPYRETVSSLKLRGSWGETGNNTVDPYTFFQGINLGSNYSLNNSVVRTASPGSLVNRGLTWESTTQWNVGLDAEFWGGLLGVTADYWQKRTEGILLNLPIPDLVGLGGPPQNAGVVDNAGWELSLSHTNQLGGEFNYRVEANLSNFTNEVVDLARTGPFIEGNTITRVGSSLNAVYGYRTDGLFQSEEEIQNNPTYAGKGDTYPGDVKYVDTNGDGNITPDDRVVLGNLDPHYSFGLSTHMQYRGFDLGLRLQGVGKQNRTISGAPFECGNWLNPVVEACSDYWTEDNRDASIPRPQTFSSKNHQLSERWIIDASYIRLKNVQLGYTLPSSLTNAISASELRVYAQGTDLLTFSEATKWGVDPELNSGRQNFYPQTARYTLGLNLTF